VFDGRCEARGEVCRVACCARLHGRRHDEVALEARGLGFDGRDLVALVRAGLGFGHGGVEARREIIDGRAFGGGELVAAAAVELLADRIDALADPRGAEWIEVEPLLQARDERVGQHARLGERHGERDVEAAAQAAPDELGDAVALVVADPTAVPRVDQAIDASRDRLPHRVGERDVGDEVAGAGGCPGARIQPIEQGAHVVAPPEQRGEVRVDLEQLRRITERTGGRRRWVAGRGRGRPAGGHGWRP
jgi:hypothetical protein